MSTLTLSQVMMPCDWMGIVTIRIDTRHSRSNAADDGGNVVDASERQELVSSVGFGASPRESVSRWRKAQRPYKRAAAAPYGEDAGQLLRSDREESP